MTLYLGNPDDGTRGLRASRHCRKNIKYKFKASRVGNQLKLG